MTDVDVVGAFGVGCVEVTAGGCAVGSEGKQVSFFLVAVVNELRAC
jgi:hypothetical protein